jgi:hypothetical protein
MKTLSVFAFAGALLFAQRHPDLTGTWKLSVDKSDYGGQPPMKSIEATVERSDTVFKYSVKGVNPEGESFEDAEELIVDGKPHEAQQGGTYTMKWEGNSLVEENSSSDGSYEQHTRITPSNDGKSLVREVQRRGPNGEGKTREVYEKQ